MGTLESYEVLELIGKGTFGKVSKIKRKEDGKILVWKELNYGVMGDKEKQQLVQEVNLLQKLRHPHIVRYYDRIVDRENTTLFIVMEFCEAGDLASYIRKCRKERTYIDEEVIWKYATQLILALADCHKRTGDIKPGNVFLDADKNVKLGDFGLARILGEGSLFAHTYVGTPYYMSPEQISGLPYNEKCDIWSFGCLIYEMAALFPPFEAVNQAQLTKKINEGKFARIPEMYSEDLFRLITLCLNINRAKRVSIDDLLKFPPLALRIRERKVTQQYNILKKKEEDLKSKETEIASREHKLAEKEREIAAREAALLRSEHNTTQQQDFVTNNTNLYKKIPVVIPHTNMPVAQEDSLDASSDWEDEKENAFVNNIRKLPNVPMR